MSEDHSKRKSMNASRRRFLASLSALGAAAAALPNASWAQDEEEVRKITKEIIEAAEKIAGLEFTDAERELMLSGVNNNLENYEALRGLGISNDVPPAMQFNPIVPNAKISKGTHGGDARIVGGVKRPAGERELAYMSLTSLAELIRTRQISAVELTKFYLNRLKRENEVLEAVITFTEERAMKSAEAADKEIAAGNYRGPLHGIPWGAKDLLAVKGYKTTWGAMPYKDQEIDADATVVTKLDEAGAVLIAKTTLGALAWGDVWFGGKTRNPWDMMQGSSGSSAGSASTTAAGCVGFAIGSETWGSIVSPSTICGTTGLRPTFGRVSRAGAMALSWSMDKLGPICRTVEDCAYVFSAIHGADPGDPSSVNHLFSWRREIDPKKVRIGYIKSAFEEEREGQEEWKEYDQRTLKTLEGMGFELVPIEMPDIPAGALSFILNVEAATAFDELTRSNADDQLVRQVANAWPNAFRTGRMVPAVEYMQANRARTLLMQKMAEAIAEVDCYVSPSWVGPNLLITNLTGHPAVVLPNGFRSDGTPTSITFNGHLFGEETLLAVANAYQQATDYHTQHPDLAAERIEYKKKQAEAEKEEKK